MPQPTRRIGEFRYGKDKGRHINSETKIKIKFEIIMGDYNKKYDMTDMVWIKETLGSLFVAFSSLSFVFQRFLSRFVAFHRFLSTLQRFSSLTFHRFSSLSML